MSIHEYIEPQANWTWGQIAELETFTQWSVSDYVEQNKEKVELRQSEF